MADGYIYLIHIREFIKTGESIFKIGRTEDPFKRIKQYPNGSKLILTVEVMDNQKVENELIHQFKLNFKQVKKIGSEYFEGDVNKMKTIIWDYCQHQIEQEKMKKNLLKDALLNEIERRKIPPAPTPPVITLPIKSTDNFFEQVLEDRNNFFNNIYFAQMENFEVKKGKDIFCKKTYLYEIYRDFCISNGNKPLNNSNFKNMILKYKAVEEKRDRIGGTVYLGYYISYPTSDILEEYFYTLDDPNRKECEYGEAVNIPVSALMKVLRRKNLSFVVRQQNSYKGKYFTNVMKNAVWGMGDEHWRREKYEKPKRNEGKNTQRIETVYLKKGTELIDVLKIHSLPIKLEDNF